MIIGFIRWFSSHEREDSKSTRARGARRGIHQFSANEVRKVLLPAEVALVLVLGDLAGPIPVCSDWRIDEGTISIVRSCIVGVELAAYQVPLLVCSEGGVCR